MSYFSSRYSLLTGSVINTGVDCWTRYLRNITDPDNESFKEGYMTILHSITAVLIANGNYQYSSLYFTALYGSETLTAYSIIVIFKEVNVSCLC